MVFTRAQDGGGPLGESRVTRAEALARTLESEIVTATLSPGERIGTKGDLRQRFGVAVATINEAVRLMEMRGLVVARPGPRGGVFVTSPSARASHSQLILGFDWGKATLADCVEVRDALEPLICRHAARAHKDADIRVLGKIIDRMEGSMDDPHRYFERNWEFHRRLASVCRNAPLKSIYLLIADFLQSGLGDLEAEVIEPERIVVHRELLIAIDHREGPELEEAMGRHAAQSPLMTAP
jgi:DNA-binding FadR family transcriptional regulator